MSGCRRAQFLLLIAVLSRQSCFNLCLPALHFWGGGGEGCTLLRWPPRCRCLPTAAVALWAEVRRARPGFFSHVEIDPGDVAVPSAGCHARPCFTPCCVQMSRRMGLVGTLPRWVVGMCIFFDGAVVLCDFPSFHACCLHILRLSCPVAGGVAASMRDCLDGFHCKQRANSATETAPLCTRVRAQAECRNVCAAQGEGLSNLAPHHALPR